MHLISSAGPTCSYTMFSEADFWFLQQLSCKKINKHTIRLHHVNTRHGSSVGSGAACDASSTEIDPHVWHVLS